MVLDWTNLFASEGQKLKAASRFRETSLPREPSFVHNDYLGLARHPRLIEAGRAAYARYGAGSRGSRLLGGHSEIFARAEARLADYFGAPAALFFSTGYLANVALGQALGTLAGHFFSDERCHASLIDGMRLTKLPRTIVPHNAWSAADVGASSVMVAESLYSMDGDFADFTSLRAKWLSSGAFLVLDEAHAAGAFAERGRGMSEGWRDWDRMAMVVTLGKAFGAAGAVVLGTRALVDLLVNTGRGFIYTTAPAPAIPAVAIAACDVLDEQGDSLRAELWDRATRVREILCDGKVLPRSFDEWERRSPIVPIPVPGDDRALRFSQTMRESGYEMRAIRHPTVARGTERIRVSLSLAVRRDETLAMAGELVKRWKEFSSRERIPT